MEVVAGIDGCPSGWICIKSDISNHNTSAFILNNISSIISLTQQPNVVAIDIPIGLPESGRRECDIAARRIMGEPRQRSVFPAPIRPALEARSRIEADRITRSVDGRGVGVQAWGLYKKIRSVDLALKEKPELRSMFYEVHPELSFMEMNEGIPIASSKKIREGREARIKLLVSYFGIKALEETINQFRKKDVNDDDIYDAFAALWTAKRIYKGEAKTVTDKKETDSTGLHMEIWY